MFGYSWTCQDVTLFQRRFSKRATLFGLIIDISRLSCYARRLKKEWLGATALLSPIRALLNGATEERRRKPCAIALVEPPKVICVFTLSSYFLRNELPRG
jgi:hypothetical protein